MRTLTGKWYLKKRTSGGYSLMVEVVVRCIYKYTQDVSPERIMYEKARSGDVEKLGLTSPITAPPYRHYGKAFKPPFRVGKKQQRAVLDANGHEVVIFPVNSGNQAQLYCDYLNEAYFN